MYIISPGCQARCDVGKKVPGRLAAPILNDKVFHNHMPLFLTLTASIKMPTKTFVLKPVRKKQLKVHFVYSQTPMNAAETLGKIYSYG